MKKLFAILLPVICILLSSCDKGAPTTPCDAPAPLQPSFTQSSYQVHAGQTVTFTYNGPVQPEGVNICFYNQSDVDPKDDDLLCGDVVTFTYNTVGTYTVTCEAWNCNDDRPKMKRTPCVTVIP